MIILNSPTKFHKDIITKQKPITFEIIKPVLTSRSYIDRGIFVATAYHMGTITSTGRRVKVGRTIAVDPRVIPYDTKVKITCEEYPEVNGHYIAEDCGGAIKGKKIDIYMESDEKAFYFGRRQVNIKIVKEE